jgi:hypothetical protein
MPTTFFKATGGGKTRYIPVAAIKQVVIDDAEPPRVRLVLEGSDLNLQGEEATAAIAALEQLSQAPARRSRRGLI